VAPSYEDEGPAARIVKMVPSILWFTIRLIWTKPRTKVKLMALKECFLGGNPSFLSFSFS